MKEILALGAIKSGILKSLRDAITFNHSLDEIKPHYIPIVSNPKIEEIVRQTTLGYREAEVIYNLSHDYDTDLELLIPLCLNVGSATGIRRLIHEKIEKRDYPIPDLDQ